MVRIISFYLLKEHIGPFLLGLAVLTFILLLEHIFDLLDLLIGKGIDVFTVLLVFLLSLPFILAVSIPMSVLVATLMAFGRLSQDNEITAIKSAGIGFHRLLTPVVICSVGIAIFLIYFNNYILPETNHKLKNIMIDIQQKRPTLQFKENIFMDDFEGYRILIKKVNDKHSTLEGITIYDLRNTRTPRTVIAQKGKFEYSQDGNLLTLKLFSGEVHEVDPSDPRNYRRIIFETQSLNFRIGTELIRQHREYRGDREMSVQALHTEIKKIQKEIEQIQAELEQVDSATKNNPGSVSYHKLEYQRQNLIAKQRQIDRYWVEIHKKFSIPFACLVFVMIGAPLGVTTRRGGIKAFAISLGFFVLYYIFLIGGEQLADRGFISPFWSMWTPNILLGAVGLYLCVRIAKETAITDKK